MSTDGQAKLYDLLKKFRTAMLVTRADDGHIRGRPMALAETESDASLWFATSQDSPKIAEIEADPTVAVTLQEGQLFISLSGRATVVRDRAKIDELWSEAWKLWFEGKDDPELVLIKFDPTEGEYWDGSGVQGVKFLAQAVKAIVGGKDDKDAGGDDDQNQKVKL